MSKSKRDGKVKNVFGGKEAPNKAPAKGAKKETRGEGGFKNRAMNGKR